MDPIITTRRSDEITVQKMKAPTVASGNSVVILAGPGAGRGLPLGANTLTFGRVATCDVPIECEEVSREHARILPVAAGYTIVDLGSTNGTFVNEQRIVAKELRDGDLIRVGTCVMKFAASGNLEAEYLAQLYALARADALTGAASRKHFDESLRTELRQSEITGRMVSLIIFDVDHFKKVNDVYGHAGGDHVLREVARIARTALRPHDLVSRIGGEEFAIVCPGTEIRHAHKVAERVRAAIASALLTHDGQVIPVTASFGVSSATGKTHSSDAIFKEADAKLYEAKRDGRNCVR